MHFVACQPITKSNVKSKDKQRTENVHKFTLQGKLVTPLDSLRIFRDSLFTLLLNWINFLTELI